MLKPPTKKALCAAGSACLLLAAAWFALLLLAPPPDPYAVKPAGTQVFARDGSLLRGFLSPDEKWRLHVSLDEISPHLVRAVLLHEDRRFRYHPGIDPIAVARSIWKNVAAGRVLTGASTITMQLVRIVEPYQRSYRFKAFQMFRALQYEWIYSKDEILEMYLNLAYYGGNIEGVGAASYLFFGKSPAELSIAEAALLAILPQSPTRRHPVRFPKRAREARDRLITRLEAQGIIDRAAAREARLRPVPSRLYPLPFDAPHFTEWILRRTRGGEGVGSTAPGGRMRTGRGHRNAAAGNFPATNPVTTIDPDLQQRAAAMVRATVAALRPTGISQGAAVILDYENAQLLAMVGSAGFFDSLNAGQVNGAVARRSPGSTLKPFVYALAFDRGLATPATLLEDVPVSFGSYRPANFDAAYLGMIRADQALQTSRNVPAILLAARLERGRAPGLYDLLKRAGVASLDRPADHYGLALVLGGGDLTLLELAELYGMLARQGTRVPTRTLMDGRAGAHGRDTWHRQHGSRGAEGAPGEGQRILSRESAYLTLQVLTGVPRPELDVVWRSGRRQIPIPWKTGTSYGHRDAWSVGIAGSYVVAVWLGNFDGAGAPHLIGRRVAAPLLFGLIDLLARSRPGSWHVAPPGLAYREVCALSGAPPSEHCPGVRREIYIPGISPAAPCDIHRAVLVDTETGHTVCSRCRVPGRYTTRVVEWWPPRVSAFMAANRMVGTSIPPHRPDCPAFGAGEDPVIVSPQNGMAYHIRPGVPLEDQKIALNASVSRGSHELYWFLDGALIWKGEPGKTAFLDPVPGIHRLTAKDDAGRSAAVTVMIEGGGFCALP